MKITFKNIVSVVKSILKKDAEKDIKKAVNNVVAHSILVGDIFTESWGYEQTNVDAYQVVKVNKASVVLRKIGLRTLSCTGWASDTVEPIKDAFIEDPEITYTKRVGKDAGYLKGIAYGMLSKHREGKSLHRSWYA